ncbi:MAG: uroporphyrinogen-III C-methyltransferase [Litorilituus sp.]|jgi:uroporphyrin-3 C-methyltransferase|nr:uroporphyrinogen-III C-methyltransferase [Litorilituus sp.]
MTEKKTPLVEQKAKIPEADTCTNKVHDKSNAIKKELPTKHHRAKSNKLAIVAIIISLAAPIGHHAWQTHQKQQLTEEMTEKISQKSTEVLSQVQAKLQKKMTQQQNNFNKQLREVKEQTENSNQATITQLTQKIAQLDHSIQQRQPSDWLTHEAEYLIRIAARTLWLEHNTTAAIGLLMDADNRLSELNNPTLLPVRELIHQDLNTLKLMPVLQTDEVILSLMSMAKEVNGLPLAVEELGKKPENSQILELSDDVSDWQSNLSKTWRKFLNDFIRVRQRSGNIEPLISPEQHKNLKQNLRLKIQLALWAASERKGDIYRQALEDVELWLHEFFAMNKQQNQQFLQSLQQLKTQTVSFNYTTKLASLSAIRAALTPKTTPLITEKAATEISVDEQKKLEDLEQNKIKKTYGDFNKEGNL